MFKPELRSLARYALPHLIQASLSQLALSLAHLAQAAALCFSLYSLFAQTSSFWASLLALVLASCLYLALNNWRHAQIPGLQARLRNDLCYHLLPAFFAAPLTQNEARQHTLWLQGISSLESYFIHYLPLVINAFIICSLCTITTFFADSYSALCLLLCAILTPLAENLWLFFTKKPANSFFASIARLNHYLHDSLMGLETLKVFNAEQRRCDRLIRLARQLRRQGLQVLRLVLPRNALTGLFGFACMILAISIAIIDYQHKTIDALQLLWVFFFAREMFHPVDALDKTTHIAWAAQGAARQIMASLQQQPDLATSSALAQPLPPTEDDCYLDVEDLTHRWFDKAPLLFEQISFRLKPGQILAITGASGSGKSSLLNILLGFLPVQQGQVRLAGHQLNQLQAEQILQHYSCVFQHFHIFDGSLLDNLCLPGDHTSMDQVVAACQLACIHEEIMQLPQQYASPLGQFGVQLSGGQKQRLALARAWLRPAPVLILDEALAQLDQANEFAILHNLRRNLGKRGLIMVSHHLPHLKLADQILLLNQSAPAELGSHDELVSRSTTYNRLLAATQIQSQDSCHGKHYAIS